MGKIVVTESLPLDGVMQAPGRTDEISGQLVRTLAAGLVDRYVLLIHPLVLGTGRRLLEGAELAKLRLVESVTTGTGVIIATCEA